MAGKPMWFLGTTQVQDCWEKSQCPQLPWQHHNAHRALRCWLRFPPVEMQRKKVILFPPMPWSEHTELGEKCMISGENETLLSPEAALAMSVPFARGCAVPGQCLSSLRSKNNQWFDWFTLLLYNISTWQVSWDSGNIRTEPGNTTQDSGHN